MAAAPTDMANPVRSDRFPVESARDSTMGRIDATMAVLLMNADSTPATKEISAMADRSPSAMILRSNPPIRSTTPDSYTA